ncbi:aldose 1-epimerase [Formosa agariphila KMM 3901]|uniref:Aldose 1-epimerase n=1 Tax=Formosa agariphila (strain DSM 15362 / KCTC 12365 / LMG 23005 / KMM 3901 / M-2Alg 35-1) TaxID=1347342 RepID=T2KNV1_FORAG|nr:aldose 1-epimerase family protein [Formosa agariphila]CDF80138.1 aldose 1-epimerase [Formosa agariphila KMM 3901]
MYTLQNELLKIEVNKTGAELSEISAIKNPNQFMWDANPDVWANFAPNLFPIIGALKDDTMIFNGASYNMAKHGIIRNNTAITLEEQTDTKLSFSLLYSEDTLKHYPFKFKFTLEFELIENKIIVTHTVENLDDNTLYFSVGGHPAFKCPLYDTEAYTDYYLEFEQKETAESYVLNMDIGLVTDSSFPVISDDNKINLHYDLFNKDALIFKDLKSRKVALKSKKNGTILTVDYPDFPYLGIWAKPHANYVCIEPWLGVADNETHNQDFKTKEGIQSLASKQTFKAAYTIEIDQKHLV